MRRLPLQGGVLLASLAAALPGYGMEGHTGHRQHGMGHTMADGQNAAAPEHGAGEHAAHAAMMANPQEYQRSTADYRLPPLQLRDSNGAPFSLAEIDQVEGPVVVSFIYTSCTTVCPVLTRTLAEARRQTAGSGISPHWFSITIDPEHDTPEQLARYAAQQDAGPDWRFITGEPAAIVRAQRAFDAWRGDKMNHAPMTFVRGAADQPWVRLDGFTGAEGLVRELRRAVQ